MRHRMIDGILILLLISLTSQQTADADGIITQEVSQGIESVNGSDVNMGCTSPLVDSGDGVMVCSSGCSTLLDGISPTINTSTSDWASQLVTVRRTDRTVNIPSPHVLLTFGFSTTVSLTGIELDLFLCPEWNIGAPLIEVFANNESNIAFSIYSGLPKVSIPPSNTECGSLSTVRFNLANSPLGSQFITWHIVVFVLPDSIEWVHVGEVRFLGADGTPTPICTKMVEMTSAQIPRSGIASTVFSTTDGMSTLDMTAITSNLYTLITTSSNTQDSTASVNFTSMKPSNIQLSPTSLTLNITSETITSSITSETITSSITSETITSSTTQSFISTLPPYITVSTIPTNNDSTSVDNVVVAAIVGLILLVLLLVFVVIGLYFVRIRYHSRVKQKVVNDRDYELKETRAGYNDPSHPQCDSDHHSAPTAGGLDVSNPMYMQANDSTQTKIVTASGEEFTSMYNVITPIVTGTTSKASEVIESATYALVQHGEGQSDAYQTVSDITNVPQSKGLHTSTINKASEFIVSAGYSTVQLGNEQCYALPNALDLTEAPKGKKSARPVHVQSHDQDLQPTKNIPHTVKGEDSDIPIRSYSVVQVKELPMVPPKSSDLELYLDRQSALNKSTTFFSEAINPADFTRNKMEGGESDPEIFAPIYTVSTVLPKSCHQPADVTSNNITERMVLGTGQFGQVVLAETNGLNLKTMGLSKTDNRERSIIVAVKKVKTHPSQKQQEAFDREIKFMSQLRHPNVLRILGICYQDPPFIMMEYTEEGDLNQFVKRYSEIVTSPSNDTQIATSTVVYMASQITSAMQYLSKLNFVHRDLATRNCFIGKNCSIKLGDLGVDMNLYKTNYYRIRGNKLLPIRWMATECFSGRFSEKSDVWAFGVTMWELFTLAKDVPYPHLSDEEVIHNALKREYRLFPSRAAACPQPVYEIMEQCWIIDLKQRATFDKLHTMLQISM